MSDKFKNKKSPNDTLFHPDSVPTPEQFEHMPQISLQEKDEIISRMSEREIFEALLISEIASFIVNGLKPSTRTPKMIGIITSQSAKFGLEMMDRLILKSGLSRGELENGLRNRGQSSHTDVILSVERRGDCPEEFDA